MFRKINRSGNDPLSVIRYVPAGPARNISLTGIFSAAFWSGLVSAFFFFSVFSVYFVFFFFSVLFGFILFSSLLSVTTDAAYAAYVYVQYDRIRRITEIFSSPSRRRSSRKQADRKKDDAGGHHEHEKTHFIPDICRRFLKNRHMTGRKNSRKTAGKIKKEPVPRSGTGSFVPVCSVFTLLLPVLLRLRSLPVRGRGVSQRIQIRKRRVLR